MTGTFLSISSRGIKVAKLSLPVRNNFNYLQKPGHNTILMANLEKAPTKFRCISPTLEIVSFYRGQSSIQTFFFDLNAFSLGMDGHCYLMLFGYTHRFH